ncbi:hypothetical protein ACSVC9_10405 [Clostridium sp. LBM24168]
MAEREIYHLDIVIGVKGDDDTKKRLSAMDKYLASMEKRARILNKINASPAVRINDKITKQMEKINGGLKKLNKAAVNPIVQINDKATKQLEKINGNIGRFNKMKVAVTTSIIDKISGPVSKIKGGLDRLNSAGVFVKTNIIDRVSGPTKTILSGLGKIKGTAWSATVTIKDKISSGLGIIRRGITKTMGMAVSLQGILLGVGGTWAGIVRPMQISGDFEQTQMAFTTMLKSAQKANSFLFQAQNMANATPFEFPQLADASKKMLAFGWNVKQILPDLSTIGDAASGLGLGADGINQITLALGLITLFGRVINRIKTVKSKDFIIKLLEAIYYSSPQFIVQLY